MGYEKTVLREGSGPVPQRGQTVTVHCTGYGKNNDLRVPFWSTKDAGQKPFSFQLGLGRVIPAWDQGVATMKLGEVARITASPDFAYGASGFPAWGFVVFLLSFFHRFGGFFFHSSVLLLCFFFFLSFSESCRTRRWSLRLRFFQSTKMSRVCVCASGSSVEELQGQPGVFFFFLITQSTLLVCVPRKDSFAVNLSFPPCSF